MVDSYIFNPTTGDTQAKLARRRQLLEAVLARGRRTPKNLGEGIDAAGEDLGAALGLNRVGAQEADFERGSRETLKTLPEGSLASSEGGVPGAVASAAAENPTDGRVKIASALSEGEKPSAMAAIRQFESGGRNIEQGVVGPGGGYNPSVGKVTGPSSASGLYQMINPTWRSAAAMAGIDTKQFPRAINAPEDLQTKAAQALFAKEGFKPWAPYNAALRQHIRSKGGPGAFKNADAGSEQKIAAAYGYNGPPADPSQTGPGSAMVGDQPDARVASLSADSNIATDAMPPAAVGPQAYERMELEGETPAPVSREALAATLAQTEPPQEQAAQLPPDVGPPPQEAYRDERETFITATTDVAPTFAGGAATFGQEPAETRGIPPGGGQALAEMGPPAIPPEAAPLAVPPVPPVPASQPVPPVPPPRPAPPPQAPVAAQPTRQMLARAMAQAPMDGQPEGGMNVRQALEDRARMGGMGFMPPAAPVPLAAPAGAPAGITPPVPAGATPPPQAAPPAVAANPADIPAPGSAEAQGKMTSEADAKDAALVKAADTALRDKPMTKEDRGYVEKLRTEALTRIERRRTEALVTEKESRIRKETQDRDERQRTAAEERQARTVQAAEERQRRSIEEAQKRETDRQDAQRQRDEAKAAADAAKEAARRDPANIAREEEAKAKAAAQAKEDVEFGGTYQIKRNTLSDIRKDVRDTLDDKEALRAALDTGETFGALKAKIARMAARGEVISGPVATFISRHNKLTGGVYLGALEDLRGFGSVAIAEGNAAKAAKARISEALSLPEYEKAVKEYDAAIERIIKISDTRAASMGLKPMPRDDDPKPNDRPAVAVEDQPPEGVRPEIWKRISPEKRRELWGR